MKSIFKFIRSLRIVNWPIRIIIKGIINLNNRLFHFFSLHWPVSGVISFDLPNKDRLKLYSRTDDFISTQAFWKGYTGYEVSLLPYFHLTTKCETIVDIGANIGYFSVIAGSANKNANIYAFEPVDTIANRFRKNVQLNGLTNIQCFESIISNNEETKKFFVPNVEGIPLAASVQQGWFEDSKELIVPSTTLDAFKNEHIQKKVDFIKMDCELHEVEVLEGMKNILKEDRPIILMEILFPEAPGVKDYFETDIHLHVERILKENGYYFYLINDTALIRVDKLQYNPDDRNYIFSTKKSDNPYLSYSDPETLINSLL